MPRLSPGFVDERLAADVMVDARRRSSPHSCGTALGLSSQLGVEPAHRPRPSRLEVESMPGRSSGETAREGVLTEEDLSVAGVPEAADARSKIVFVAGSGRSGTSLMSGILKHMGLYVPEPEVAADKTNPKGFGEPQWVVDFHNELLERVNVHPGDARPGAWFDAGRAGTREPNRTELTNWLRPHVEQADALVIKDPRISWFLGMWRVAAVRVGASSSTITMLRPPAEVVGSKNTYYGGRLDDISRLAGWTNMMLFTERATRGSSRSFVRYHDLLTDWTRTLVRVGEELGLADVTNAGPGRMQEVHRFVDPELRRIRSTWDDLSVPTALREIAAATWEQLDLLAEPGGDTPALHQTLDGLRRDYATLYAEAEAMARSSVNAAGPAYLRKRQEAEAAAAERAYAAATGPRKAYLRTRRAAGRVKRRLAARNEG
jgi:hypothetical protein